MKTLPRDEFSVKTEAALSNYVIGLLTISDATLDVITSNLMFSTHHLMFDVFADESDVKRSGC